MTWLTRLGIWEAEQGRRGQVRWEEGEPALRGCHWGLPGAAKAQAPWGPHSYLPQRQEPEPPTSEARAPWAKELPALSRPVPGPRRPRAPTQPLGQEVTGSWWEPGEDHTAVGQGRKSHGQFLGALQQKSNRAGEEVK